MLSDVIEIVKFSIDLLTKYKTKENICRQLYFLYMALIDVQNASNLLVNRTFRLDPNSPVLLQTRSFPTPNEKYVTLTNQDFEALTHSVIKFIRCFQSVGSALEIYDENLKRIIDWHFQAKSAWVVAFYEVYFSGKVELSGKKLKRKLIKMAKLADLEESSSRFDSSLPQSLFDEVEIDISSGEKRAILAATGRENIKGLELAKAELAEFIRTNCKIGDLL